MFGIGSTELLVILVVALIVLGPKSLATVSRSLGKVIGEFRRVSTDFQRSLNVEAAREEMREAEAKKTASAPCPASGTDRETQAAGMSQPAANQGGEEKAGPPPDSPLGQAIARAQAEAAGAGKQAQPGQHQPEGAPSVRTGAQPVRTDHAHG